MIHILWLPQKTRSLVIQEPNTRRIHEDYVLNRTLPTLQVSRTCPTLKLISFPCPIRQPACWVSIPSSTIDSSPQSTSLVPRPVAPAPPSEFRTAVGRADSRHPAFVPANLSVFVSLGSIWPYLRNLDRVASFSSELWGGTSVSGRCLTRAQICSERPSRPRTSPSLCIHLWSCFLLEKPKESIFGLMKNDINCSSLILVIIW